MFSCINYWEFGLQLGLNIQPRHQPIETLGHVSYSFLSIYFIIHDSTKRTVNRVFLGSNEKN
jgi:hypothetical protein